MPLSQVVRRPGIIANPGRLLVLVAILAAAEPSEALAPDAGVPEPAAPAAAVDVRRPSALAQTGAHLAFSGGVIVTSLLVTALCYLPGTVYYGAAGRPEPLVPTTAMIAGGALKVAVTYWLLPELYRTGGGTPDIEAARQAMWRLVRWPAITAAVSIAVLILGAALENGHFGRGQNLMIGGFAGLTGSLSLFDILSIVGSSQGYRR